MSKYLLNPYKLSPETCRTRQYEKICTKSSLHWEDCFFFKNFCFQQPLRSYENKLITWTINVKRPPGPLQFVPWRLSCSILRGKIGQNSFSLASSPFFFKSFVYSTKSYVLQKWSFNFHSKCYNTFWTQINCSVKFVTLDNRRKNRPKSFLHWKVCLFLFESCVFNNPLGVTETIL